MYKVKHSIDSCDDTFAGLLFRLWTYRLVARTLLILSKIGHIATQRPNLIKGETRDCVLIVPTSPQQQIAKHKCAESGKAVLAHSHTVYKSQFRANRYQADPIKTEVTLDTKITSQNWCCARTGWECEIKPTTFEDASESIDHTVTSRVLQHFKLKQK